MVAFWWYVIESGKFDTIEHKFPKPGHTFMPIDSDFGKIETKGKQTQYIYLPSDLEKIVGEARRANPFSVLRMEPQTLLSFDPVTYRLINRKKTLSSEDVHFQKVSWLWFD